MVNPLFRPGAPFQTALLDYLQDKLESLTVPQHRGWAGPVQREILTLPDEFRAQRIGTPPITLRGFKRLRRLDLPMGVLGLPHSVSFQCPGENEHLTAISTALQIREGNHTSKMKLPAKIIPLTLETLQLRDCTSTTFVLLEVISSIPVQKSRFKHIDLYLTPCAREFIHLCRQARYPMRDYIEILSKVEDMGIQVSFFSGKDEKFVDMRQELANMHSLVDTEVNMLSAAHRQFSALNELAVQRRNSSESCLEHKMFIQYAASHFDLLNSPTFAAEYCRSTAFFTGHKHVFERSLTTYPRWDSLLDVGNFKFTFLEPTPRTPSAPPTDPNTKIFTLDPELDDPVVARAKGLFLNMSREAQARAIAFADSLKDETTRKTFKPAEISNSKSKRRKRRVRYPTIQEYRVQVRLGYYDPIVFDFAEELVLLGRSKHFLIRSWRDVEWKKYLQPRVGIGLDKGLSFNRVRRSPKE
jgi:hypothetical protein